MTFKEQLQSDIDDVFLNADEFAEVHNLNGVTAVAVVQQVVVTDDLLTTDKSGAAYHDGLYAEGALINVKKSALPKVPAVGSSFRLDGRYGYVAKVSDDEGLLTITWAVNEL